MAAKDSTSRVRRIGKGARTAPQSGAAASCEQPQAPADSLPQALRVTIEAERSRLMRAEAILHCAALALNEDERPRAEAPDYESVINTARAMISETVERLDSVSLRAALRYAQAEEGGDFALAAQRGVRESAPLYLH